MRRTDLALSWVLALCCLFMGAVQSAVAQDTSTPQERAQWVEVTHKLESSPLDDAVNKQGEAVFKRLGDVHDVHVLLCPALFERVQRNEVHLRAHDHAAIHAGQRRFPNREP
jgi:hypothetical protein